MTGHSWRSRPLAVAGQHWIRWHRGQSSHITINSFVFILITIIQQLPCSRVIIFWHLQRYQDSRCLTSGRTWDSEISRYWREFAVVPGNVWTCSQAYLRGTMLTVRYKWPRISLIRSKYVFSKFSQNRRCASSSAMLDTRISIRSCNTSNLSNWLRLAQYENCVVSINQEESG